MTEEDQLDQRIRHLQSELDKARHARAQLRQRRKMGEHPDLFQSADFAESPEQFANELYESSGRNLAPIANP